MLVSPRVGQRPLPAGRGKGASPSDTVFERRGFNTETESEPVAVNVEATYERYGPMVLRRCRTILRDEEQAVDAMHDTFVRLLKNKTRLRPTGLSSLLFQMATQVCLNRLRAARRHPEDPDEALLTCIAHTEDSEGQALASRILDRVFAREQPSTRVIATLHLVDGLTLEEVSREVGLSVSGVRKRLRRLERTAQSVAEEGKHHELA